MLKENQHRQKNNLNIVLSLLKLDEALFNTEATKGVFDKIISRLESLNVLYETLNTSDDNFSVPARDYFKTYFNRLDHLFNDGSINTNIEVEDIHIKQEIITPLSIIVNELYTNSVKYAFSGQADCRINFSIKKTKSSINITFSDNGIGCAVKTKQGFGLKMINTLIMQLNAEIENEHENGTKYIMRIPLG